jgi:hypothetical protein
VSRLEDLGISLVSKSPTVSVYVRDRCIAIVGDAPASQGSTGLMTEHGLAYLVWRDGRPYLAAKGSETPATLEEAEEIRKFSEDLAAALNT